jgi:propanol-preferring alcohol dehydrogenase
MEIAPKVPVRTEVEERPLEEANEALDKLRAGEVRGAIALRVKNWELGTGN